MDYYECYANSDKGGQQWIMRQMFAQNETLKRQVDQLAKEVEALKSRPTHLQLIEYRGRYPPQKLHIIDGNNAEKP